MEVKVLRINVVENIKDVKAFVDISYGGLIINGLKIVDGKEGRFVAYPQVKGKDGNYHSIVKAGDIETKDTIEKYILEQYNNRIK